MGKRSGKSTTPRGSKKNKLEILLQPTSSASLNALYSASDDVVELTQSNFASKVTKSDELWIVEFYAPWCGHCKSMAPEYKKLAKELKGTVNVGAVDMTQHQSVGAPFGIKGFPTIKIFGFNKQTPIDYNGQRTADAMGDEAFKQLRKLTKDKASGGKSSDGSGGSGNKGKSGKGSTILTDSNFRSKVIEGGDPWLVEFYAPWCGHCQQLEPEWESAANTVATETGGKVKLGHLDATQELQMAEQYGIQGYPTIKIFYPDGRVEDYNGRVAGDIVDAAMILYAETDVDTSFEYVPPTVEENNLDAINDPRHVTEIRLTPPSLDRLNVEFEDGDDDTSSESSASSAQQICEEDGVSRRSSRLEAAAFQETLQELPTLRPSSGSFFQKENARDYLVAEEPVGVLKLDILRLDPVLVKLGIFGETFRRIIILVNIEKSGVFGMSAHTQEKFLELSPDFSQEVARAVACRMNSYSWAKDLFNGNLRRHSARGNSDAKRCAQELMALKTKPDILPGGLKAAETHDYYAKLIELAPTYAADDLNFKPFPGLILKALSDFGVAVNRRVRRKNGEIQGLEVCSKYSL